MNERNLLLVKDDASAKQCEPFISHNADGCRPVERAGMRFKTRTRYVLALQFHGQPEYARERAEGLRSRGLVKKWVTWRENEDELIQENLVRNLVFE
jgi:hypothetical protein